MSLELKLEKVKPYLKLLTEACVSLNANKGSLRKDIWDYLNKKYGSAIDYRDFLLAIRKFFLDGKLINNEGTYSMHQAVIEEVREKTPTPAFKKTAEGKSQDSSLFLKFLKGGDQDASAASSRKTKTTGLSSKISDSGKKQKVKPHKESARQSKIHKYFMKKQIKNLDFKEYQKSETSTNKKLGFATPAFHSLTLKKIAVKQTPPKSESTVGGKGFGMLLKHRDQVTHNLVRRKLLEHNLNQVTKAIHKFKKPSTKDQILQASRAFKAAQTESSTAETKRVSAKEQLEQQQPKKAEISKKKEELQSKKQKLEQKGKSKLATRVIKALKKAMETNNQKIKKREEDENLEKKADKKVMLPKIQKTKAIRKLNKTQKIQRSLNKLKNGKPLVLKQRLRGKTLDLTKLGLVKADHKEENQKSKNDHKKSHQIERKMKAKSEKQEPKPMKVASVPTTPKKEKKTKVIAKRVSRSAQKPKTKKKRLLAGLSQSKKPISERKAKIDAVKNLHQLFKKDKSEALFMNGKLIYL